MQRCLVTIVIIIIIIFLCSNRKLIQINTKKEKYILVHITEYLGMYQSEVDPRSTMTGSQFLSLHFWLC